MAARLKQIYHEKIVPELKAKLELKNTMQVPRVLPTWRRSPARSRL
jgi:ribosomal protein L5